MPDVVTREERALIAAALAATPVAALRVPAGVSGLPMIRWDGSDLRYVGVRDGIRGLRAMRSRGALARARAAQTRVAERNACILDDARAGMTYVALMAKYEVSQQVIYKITARGGVAVAPAARSFDDAQALTARIVALADGVRTLGEIAAAAGCSDRSVRDRRDRLSLDIPHGVTGRPAKQRRAA